MSRENVEIVRGIYDAVARRDGVTPFEVYAEDIVWDMSNSRRTLIGIEPVYHGHEGARQFWRALRLRGGRSGSRGVDRRR